MRLLSLSLLSCRLLARDWRAGELHLLFAAVVIAVASMTTVSFFSERVSRTIVREAGQLLGGDLVLASDRPLEPAFANEARALGLNTASAVRFRSMTRTEDETLLTEVKAVSDGYPLRGQLRIRETMETADEATRTIPSVGSVWVDARLLRTLGLAPGRPLMLGERTFVVEAIISEEPEAGAGFFNFAPRLLMNMSDLDSTGLIVAGSRVQYRLYLAGDEEAGRRFESWATPRVVAGQRLENVRDARPEIRSGLERAERFLGLSTLLAVILAGVAIAMAARRYMQRHLNAAAMMRCLGAVQGEVLLVHVIQFVLVGMAASLLGGAAGFAFHQVLVTIMQPVLAVQLPGPTWFPLLHGLAAGAVLLFGFALPPLVALRRVPPMRVLRRDIGLPDAIGTGAYVLGSISFAGLILWQAHDFDLGMYVLGGVVVTIVLCVAMTLLVIYLFGRISGKAGPAWRSGLANIRRRPLGSVLQVSAIGLGLLALILLTLVRNDLLVSWRKTLPADAPNRFLVNIQTDQIDDLRRYFRTHQIDPPVLYPMVRARLIAVNDVPVSEETYVDERARRLVNREFNLSWRSDLQEDNAIVAGRWFDARDQGKAVVSVETGIAETLGLRLGDVLRYDMAGEVFDVTVASLRKVQWDTFRVNFFVLAPPGLLDDYPASWVTSFYLPHEQGVLLDGLVRQFPGFLVIDVEAILGQVVRMMDQVIKAVEFVFVFALVAGVLVLLAAITATHDERRMDAAVRRTLGATTGQLLAVQASEFAVIGAVAGLIAAVGATAVGWGLAEQVLHIPYAVNPWVWIAGLIAGVVTVTLAGLAGTRRLLKTTPVEVFRGLA